MKLLEIFSGTGGLAKGLEKAGFEHAALVEMNKHACASLRENFESEIVFEGDIADFDLGGLSSIDVVAGGPPCQPFSLGGKHKANEDERDMFPYAIRAIEKLEPKAFLFENVKGLLRSSFAEYFSYIILRLNFPHLVINEGEDWRGHLDRLTGVDFNSYSGLKYRVEFKLINAANYGVPQKRERVIIVGVRSDLGVEWSFPEATHSEDRLNWEKYVTGDYWRSHGINIQINESIKSGLIKKYGIFPPEERPWVTVRDALKGIPSPNDFHDLKDHEFRGGARSYAGHTGSEIDQPAKTIKAGAHGVPGGENMIRFEDGTVRYFTVHEAKIIQTFPKDFSITGKWGEALRQIGNAVPVLLSEKIGLSLFKLIKGTPQPN